MELFIHKNASEKITCEKTDFFPGQDELIHGYDAMNTPSRIGMSGMLVQPNGMYSRWGWLIQPLFTHTDQ